MFYARAVDFRDAKSPAYLVAYSLGTMPGNGLYSFEKALLVDRHGKKLVGLDDCGEAGIVVSILAHCRWPLHTSLLEGINNKIKVIKRMAYGFRDDQYFFLKIRAAFPGNTG